MTTPNSTTAPYSLLDLQNHLSSVIASANGTKNVWITAELSDVRESGGHCYMELLQKDPANGSNLAKARATIWRNTWLPLKHDFQAATGQPFASGLKVMVCVNASYHPLYGMNLNITAVNPSFTLGERERRRREILQRLRNEGVIDMNRELSLPRPCLRIAIVSAENAAGYGDFMDQLANNTLGVQFKCQLFAATMQGTATADSVIEALTKIAANEEQWDCVCIIRGGGSSTDLDGFDNYQLAAYVAQFPLPIIVGIGHERDTTVLDFICSQRVKTPTAAAELLVSLAQQELAQLQYLAETLLRNASDIVNGEKQRLAYIEAALPSLPTQLIQRSRQRLDSAALRLSQLTASTLQPAAARLARLEEALKATAHNRLTLELQRLQGRENLLAALSPQAVLARGYSITRINGHALTSASTLHPGDVITTTLAQGEITSTVS